MENKTNICIYLEKRLLSEFKKKVIDDGTSMSAQARKMIADYVRPITACYGRGKK